MTYPEEFTFRPESDGSLSVESAVYQALGAASVCWIPGPHGLFDSDRAKQIGDKLIRFIKFEQDEAVASRLNREITLRENQ